MMAEQCRDSCVTVPARRRASVHVVLTAALVISAGACASAFAQNFAYSFVTMAGRARASFPDAIRAVDGVGYDARFNLLRSVAIDAAGNIFVADEGNHIIRKVTASGVVTTFAGANGVSGSVNGPSDVARFKSPSGVAVDREGNVFVADMGNHLIRKIAPDGTVTTLAGAAGVIGYVDGAGVDARFSFPRTVAVGPAGDVYVADSFNSAIRVIGRSGAVTTFFRLAPPGFTVNTGMANSIDSVAIDGSGTVYFTDTVTVLDSGSQRTAQGVRKITAGGVQTLDSFGPAFERGWGISIDEVGNVLVAKPAYGVIDRVSRDGSISRIAGTIPGGIENGPSAIARFYGPFGAVSDGRGNVVVADSYAIRAVTANGFVTTLAGYAAGSGSVNDQGNAARFDQPWGCASDGGGNLLVTDLLNNTVRKIGADGVVTTLAGAPGLIASGADGVGTQARFAAPKGIAVGRSGNAFVADSGNCTIRKISPSSEVTTVAGLAGTSGSADGSAKSARFSNPEGIAVDTDGTIFVADTGNHTIRRIATDGVVTTFAGLAGSPGTVDGAGAVARFRSPKGLALDRDGNLLVADAGNHTVRKIAPGGRVTTLAGTPGKKGRGNSFDAEVGFNSPEALAVDENGNVFVADTLNGTIREITSSGVVSTLAGSSTLGTADGVGSAAQFFSPRGIAVDDDGSLFVADSSSNTIRKGVRLTRTARLINFSVIDTLSSADDAILLSTVVGGANTTGVKPMLFRATGATLVTFGIAGSIVSSPRLEYFAGTSKVAENINWGGTAALSAAFASVGAFPFRSPSSEDAALYVAEAPAGVHTARVSGRSGTTGWILAEVYDATPDAPFAPTDPRLVNASVLKKLSQASFSVGFSIRGVGERTILIRGIGPSLAAFGIAAPLANPRLEVSSVSRTGPFFTAFASSWGGSGLAAASAWSSVFRQAGAFALSDATSMDAVLVATLAPGNYTIRVSSNSARAATGMVLTEIYEVP